MLLSGERLRLSADPNHKMATLICAFKNDFKIVIKVPSTKA